MVSAEDRAMTERYVNAIAGDLSTDTCGVCLEPASAIQHCTDCGLVAHPVCLEECMRCGDLFCPKCMPGFHCEDCRTSLFGRPV